MKNSQVNANHKVIGLLIFMLFVFIAISESDSGELAGSRTYKLPTSDILELTVPKAWLDNIKIPDGPFHISITFKTPVDTRFLFSVIPLLPDENEKKKEDVTDDKIKKGLLDYADTLKSQVIDPYIQLLELRGPFVHGFYYRVTSKVPIEGKFTYLTQGFVQIGELPVSFNIFSNEGQKALENDALSVIGSAKYLPSKL